VPVVAAFDKVFDVLVPLRGGTNAELAAKALLPGEEGRRAREELMRMRADAEPEPVQPSLPRTQSAHRLKRKNSARRLQPLSTDVFSRNRTLCVHGGRGVTVFTNTRYVRRGVVIHSRRRGCQVG
jgi:hypothetical protein